jgi:hypothetical protein
MSRRCWRCAVRMSDLRTVDDLRSFLERMIVEARRMGDAEREDALLDKWSHVDELFDFLTIVLPREVQRV